MPSKLINTVDEHVVKHISELLSKAGVASFLWGDYVLRIFGVPSIIGVSTCPLPTRKSSADGTLSMESTS